MYVYKLVILSNQGVIKGAHTGKSAAVCSCIYIYRER